MKSSKVFVAAVTAAVLTGAAAPGAVIIFEQGVSPTAAYQHHGATVRNDPGNVGTANNSTRLLAGSVGTGWLRSIISYDLSDIPAGATINSVSFKIYQEADTGSSVAGNYTVQLQTISAAFDEVTASYNNTFGHPTTPMTMGAAVLSSVQMDPEVALTGTAHTFASSADFVAAVQAAVNDPANLFNFVLRVPSVEAGTSRVIMRLTADETGVAGTMVGLRPSLSVEYTPIPEPTSVALLGLGTVALIGRRRHR